MLIIGKNSQKWCHLGVFFPPEALFGIIFVRYGNWILCLKQVRNAPKFPRPSEGKNQFTNGFRNWPINIYSRAVLYFWQFSFLNKKWFRTVLLPKNCFTNGHWKLTNQITENWWYFAFLTFCGVNQFTLQLGRKEILNTANPILPTLFKLCY